MQTERMELDGIELSEDTAFFGSANKLQELVSTAAVNRVEYSRISIGWLTAVSRIDQDWLKSVKVELGT
jgi:hypothetical protein